MSVPDLHPEPDLLHHFCACAKLFATYVFGICWAKLFYLFELQKIKYKMEKSEIYVCAIW